jgi:hypothetical protein
MVWKDRNVIVFPIHKTSLARLLTINRLLFWLVDWATGRIMDVLDQLRIGENTLVIVTSENGSLLGSLKFCKPEGTAKITNGHKSIGSWCGKTGGG